jgi:hypothetical protein
MGENLHLTNSWKSQTPDALFVSFFVQSGQGALYGIEVKKENVSKKWAASARKSRRARWSRSRVESGLTRVN